MTLIVIAVLMILVFIAIDQALLARFKLRLAVKKDKFEPEEIGDLTIKAGDTLECTESYGEFTKGYHYIVRIEYGGALVVWNDEMKPVLAAGLDPRKFKVVNSFDGE